MDLAVLAPHREEPHAGTEVHPTDMTTGEDGVELLDTDVPSLAEVPQLGPVTGGRGHEEVVASVRVGEAGTPLVLHDGVDLDTDHSSHHQYPVSVST